MVKIIPIELKSFEHGLGAFCVEQGGKERWGVIDTDGNIVVEPRWVMVEIWSPEIVALWDSGGRHTRYVDIGRHAIPLENECCCYSRKMIVARKRNRTKAVDAALHRKYKELIHVNRDYLQVMDFNGKCGMLTASGKELLPTRYDEIRMCDETLYFVRIADEWFVADASGQRPLKNHYDYLDDFRHGYCIYGLIDKLKGDMCYGLIDRHENILIPATYDRLRWIGNDRLECRVLASGMWNGFGRTLKYGVIDCHGNNIVPYIYPEPLSRGIDRTYIVHQSSNVTGVVDETGRIVLPFRSWQILDACNTAAYRVYDRELKLCGLYSSSGEELLPLEFEYIDIFGDTLDYIAVCKNGEWYYVNSRNERVLL